MCNMTDTLYMGVMLYNPWAPGAAYAQHPRHQPIFDCTYQSMLVTFNKWNMVKFTNKNTSNEDLDEVHKVVLDCIGNKME